MCLDGLCLGFRSLLALACLGELLVYCLFVTSWVPVVSLLSAQVHYVCVCVPSFVHSSLVSELL